MRDNKGRWIKGAESPNPGGRPSALGDLKEAARGYSQEALETLAAVMRDPKAPPAARVTAARELLDRGFGKAVQAVDVGVKVDLAASHASALMELSRRAREHRDQARLIDVTSTQTE